MFILWVFRKFEIEEDKQRFTQKDVFYSNNRNAFILNDEAIRLSEEHKDLYLLCQYQEPTPRGERLIYEWREKYVCLNELIFDETTYKVYYYDVDKAEQKIRLEIEQNILERKKREEERLLRYREEEEKRIEEEENRNNLRLLMIEREKEREEKIQKELSEYREKYSPFFDRLKKYPNHSSLQKVFYEINISSKIEELFLIEKHIPSKEDKSFLKQEYDEELKTGNKLGRNSILQNLAYIIFFIKVLNSGLDLSLISKKKQLLLAILSIKQNKVIGYDFKKIIQIVNHFFQEGDEYYPYSGIILKAIEVYYGSVNNFINQEDKRKHFWNKLEKMKKDNPKQDKRYNEIINAIFPDLKLQSNILLHKEEVHS